MRQNLSCLLVSPQPGDRVLVEEALGQGTNHLRIEQTIDALSWQQALAAGDFNLGIIAEALPWADTPALVKSLKSRRPECPVVMLAAPEREEAAWEALRQGVDDYVLTSPEEIRRLPAVVQAARRRARRTVEESLEAEAADWRGLFDAIPQGVLVHDLETGRILDGNQEASRALGFSREELSNLDLGTITSGQPPYTAEEALKIIRKTVREGPQTVEWLARDRNRRPIWVEVTLKCLPFGGRPRVLAFARNISEVKRAQEPQREAESRYQALLDSVGDAIFIHDTAGRLLQVNDAACILLGYSREELLKRPLGDFLDAANQEILQEQMKQRQQGGRQTYELTWTRKDGTPVITSLSPVPMFDAAGKFQGSFAVIADITARKKAERELELERKKFQTLTEDSPFALVMIGADGAFKYVNPKFVELFGYELAEVPDGRTWFRKAYPDPAYRRRVISSWVEDLQRAKPREKRPRTYTVNCKDGTEKTISFNPIQLENGDNLMTCEDVTERHLAMEAVKQSEQRFRLLMENSMANFAVVDAQGKILYENPTMERILGYDIGEMKDKNSFEFIHPEDRARSLEVLMKLLESPGEVVFSEVRYRHKDGSWRFLEIKAKNLLDEPIIRGIVVNVHDITQRKEALEALRQSEERYRAIVEDQTELVTRFLADGTLTFVNETLCLYIDKSREELIGKSFYNFIPKEDRAAIQSSIAGLSQKTPFATIDHRVSLPDGQVAWHQWTNRAIFDHEGRIIEFQAVGRDITERKRAEEALQESEDLHSRILDTMPDMVYELSLDGQVIYANRTASEILGYAPEELLKRKLEDLVDAEDLAHAHRVIQEMIASRQPSRTESYHLRTAQEHFIPIETNAILVERSNQPPTIVGVARDITARLQAEQALRQSEAEKSLILRNMTEKLVYYDPDNRILWANQAMADFIGLTSDEMMGRYCYELLHHRHTACPDCQVIKSMNAGQPTEIEVVKPDGRIIFYRSSPVRDEKGRLQGNVLLTRDITARKIAEEKMRLVIESSPVGIRITQQGRHTYVNPALMHMFGYADPREIVGLPVDLLFPREEPEIPRLMPADPAVKPAPSSYEVRGLKKDGTWIEVQVWQTEIDYQGEPALLDFVLDISEARDLRNQLLQAQKMEAIGTLAGGIAHDFNNILFPILVNAEMILESLAPDNVLRRRMERVLKACERAIDLVKQILAFSRQEERGLSLVHLTPIIDDSMRLLRASLPATIEMRQHLEGAADTVLADPTQIQQVLINLYTNAAHALRDRGGVIDISLRELDGDQTRGVVPPNLGPGPYLQLTVKDNGHGMDADTRERIFDPYFTTKKSGEGTGLGLAIVHGIIKRHGGAISVESELGKGSSFHIFLPRWEGQASPETEEPTTLPQGRERVLLVDDEAEIVATIQAMLESLGYQVSAFTSSAAALDTFRAHPEDFDLVITDQTMPHLTGEELARELVDLRPDLPIIICTGFSETISPEKARAKGFREFLIKPIASRVMAHTIRRALARHQERD